MSNFPRFRRNSAKRSSVAPRPTSEARFDLEKYAVAGQGQVGRQAALDFYRAAGAHSYFDTVGDFHQVTTEDQPVFNHAFEGGTWKAKGLSLPPGTKNWNKNVAMTGGNSSTPPTGWTRSGSTGITLTYSYSTRHGMPCMRITFTGTATSGGAVQFYTGALTDIPKKTYVADGAENAGEVLTDGFELGETWSASFYPQIAGVGTIPAGTLFACRLLEMTAAGGTTSSQYTYFTSADAAPEIGRFRVQVQKTIASADVAYLRHSLYLATIAGAAYNFYIDIALPQIEKNDFATPAILNSGTALSRPECFAYLMAPEDNYDVLIQGVNTDWIENSVFIGGFTRLQPLPAEQHIRLAKAYRIGQVSEAQKIKAVGESLPAPTHWINPATGVTLDGSNRVSAHLLTSGATCTQATTTGRPLYDTNDHGPHFKFEGDDWLPYTGLGNLTTNFDILAVFDSTSNTVPQTIFGQENQPSAFMLRINNFEPQVASAFVTGETVAGSPKLTDFSEPHALMYSRQGLDNFMGDNGLMNLGLQIDSDRAFTSNGTIKTLGRRSDSTGDYLTGRVYSVELWRTGSLTAWQRRAAMKRAMARHKIVAPANQADLHQITTFRNDAGDLIASASFDTLRPQLDVKIEFSATSNFNTIIATSAPFSTTTFPGRNGASYNTVMLTCTLPSNLNPDVKYFWRPNFGDGIAPKQYGEFKPMRPKGQRVTHSSAAWSCAFVEVQNSVTAMNFLAQENIGFFLGMGDVGYSDKKTHDFGYNNWCVRRIWTSPTSKTLWLSCAAFNMPDNHDRAGSNAQPDNLSSEGFTNDVIIQQTGDIWKARVPHPILWDQTVGSTVLAYTIHDGASTYIVPDCIAQRSEAVGVTVGDAAIGYAANAPHYDQMVKIEEEILAADAAGQDVIRFESTASWHDTDGRGWQARSPLQVTKLLEIFGKCEHSAVEIWQGDVHFYAWDDGTYSSVPFFGGKVRVPTYCTSGLYRGNNSSNLAGWQWNGVNGKPGGGLTGTAPGSGSNYLVVTDEYTAGVYTRSTHRTMAMMINASSITQVGLTHSDDQPNAIEFNTATKTVAASAVFDVDIYKSWFGPVAGIQVTVTRSWGGVTTHKQRPNRRLQPLTLTAPATPGTYTVTISAPIRLLDNQPALLGTKTVLTLTVT